MTKEKQQFIRGDLNDLRNGKIPLRNQKWIDVIKTHYGSIYDEQKIWLFEVTKNNGLYDPTIFPGVVKAIGDQFEIIVNESDMQYLSECNEFKGYSLEDVIGKEWADSLIGSNRSQ